MKISKKNYEGKDTARETILTEEKAPAYTGASERVEGPKKWSKLVLQVLLATVVTGGITIVGEPQVRM